MSSFKLPVVALDIKIINGLGADHTDATRQGPLDAAETSNPKRLRTTTLQPYALSQV